VSGEETFADMLRTYLDLYGAQEPRQAVIWISQAMSDHFDSLDAGVRQSMLDEVDGVASSYGLLTPTIIQVWK